MKIRGVLLPTERPWAGLCERLLNQSLYSNLQSSRFDAQRKKSLSDGQLILGDFAPATAFAQSLVH
jgi:hypothetical protein